MYDLRTEFKFGWRGIAGVAAALLGVLYLIGGYTDVEPGDTAILIKKLGSNQGMQPQPLRIGAHWVEPFMYDVVTYNYRARQMEEISELPANTGDGQPVKVYGSLQLSLNPEFVPVLHDKVGPDFYDRVVHPALIKTIKDQFPSQPSDVVYTTKGRVAVEKSINAELTRRFGRMGIIAEFNLKDAPFDDDTYVRTLKAKAQAVQQVEVNARQALAAAQDAVRVANIAEGEKQKRIKAAEADREEQKLKGEGQRLQKEEDAKGILALAKAEAEGTRLRREALEGSGGDRLVQIEWARNLGPNVKVYGIPTGAPGTSSILDLNGVLKGAFKGAD